VQDIEVAIDQAFLDELWDFSDPEASEARFRAAGDDPELQTQVARALGLQRRFDEGERILEAIRDAAPATRVRILLEHGRLLNSCGDATAAIPLFEEAARLASTAALDFLEIDAVHMLAIADAERSSQHFGHGMQLAQATADPRSKRWLVSLHNNFGWLQFDDGQLELALQQFHEAFAAAIAYGTEDQRFYSRWAIARCQRELGQEVAAETLQRELLAERPDDADVLEELRSLRQS
jgi:Tfp pilus assembly protein PilF